MQQWPPCTDATHIAGGGTFPSPDPPCPAAVPHLPPSSLNFFTLNVCILKLCQNVDAPSTALVLDINDSHLRSSCESLLRTTDGPGTSAAYSTIDLLQCNVLTPFVVLGDVYAGSHLRHAHFASGNVMDQLLSTGYVVKADTSAQVAFSRSLANPGIRKWIKEENLRHSNGTHSLQTQGSETIAISRHSRF